ncbi:SsrA-binding protein [Beggiatoa alba B18LD]|uniref:SsrA-binding protein n=1 Tax=Beggiatoa alba B18LD TaxID=395493 RepID=I3CGU6_9GAMM|nr:SsrA-binding protein SmpB [Beggiatoa alba]EIJ42839.1 SsrA-binding protein [Beggiatoa alba B18LD]
MTKKNKTETGTICLNKKAGFDFFLLDRYESGLVLQGWEVKSLRAGKVQIKDSYILVKDREAFLFGALITPLQSASTHIFPESQRTRKLLLNRGELNKLIGSVERKGLAIVPTAMYWKNGRVKLEIALAKGKKEFDKRETEKARDWNREKERLFKK